MRILRVIQDLDPAGGGPLEALAQQSRLLALQGHRTTIAVLDDPESIFPAPPGTRAVHLGRGFTAWRWHPLTQHRLEALARWHDVLVVEGLWSHHALAGRAAARRAGIPYLVFTHGMLDPYFRHRHPWKHLKKCCFWPWAEYRVLRDAAAVCFTCEEERRKARFSFPGLYMARERVVPLGIMAPPAADVAQTRAFAEACPEVGNHPFLLFLSRIHPKKGCDLAIRAFASACGEAPDLHLVMAGPDQVGWSQSLQDLASGLGIDRRVHWPGMLRGAAKWGAFREAEAFLLPSHQENFGLVVAEALACATPVLTTIAVDLWRDVVTAGAGLAEADTAEGVGTLLRRWSGLDPAARNAMGASALQLYRTRFDAIMATRRFLQVLIQSSKVASHDQ